LSLIRNRLKNPHNIEKKTIITNGNGYGRLATMGDKIVMNLPNTLQQPYAVANSIVGNNSVLIRYAMSNAQTIPKFVINISIELNMLLDLILLFDLSVISSAINTNAKLPKVIKIQLHNNAFLRGMNFYINMHATDAKSSATSVAIDK
jgi:hypothetical protein